jgi:prepilin-type N-terminal cleavage/methylation domain-containing protein
MTVKHKYTIFKVLTQNSTNGFTLIELIFGLLIMGLVGGFTLNALVEASNSFNQDRKSIQSAQNLTTVLELIGNDIKQAGERISGDDSFPTIEIQQESSATLPEDGSPVQRSSLIVRRAVVTRALTLCADIPVGTATGLANLVVRDTALTTNPNCNQNPAPSAAASPLREGVNYRCELGDPNYNYNPTQDSCNPVPANPNNDATLQNVLVAVSRQDGNICMFRYTGENLAFSPTQSRLTVTPLSTCASGVAYDVSNPIYLLEERRYTLDTSGNLTVSVNGGTPSTLISGIAKFKVSARGYVVTAPGVVPAIALEDRVIDPSGGGGTFACTAADGVSMPAGAATTTDPTYACRLNFGANMANWKQIAGVRIELQAKYDPTGRATYANALPADIEKLTANAEFFPRNVLSK